MTRILLTGNRFLGQHVLDCLLARGHSVVIAVTQHSAPWLTTLKRRYPYLSKDKLDFAISDYRPGPDAFHEAVISDPPFETVIHTAHLHYARRTNVLEPRRSPIGSTGILEAIKKNAPAVKRVVITSSCAALFDPRNIIAKKYSEADWNNSGDSMFAEREAWDFVEKEKPNFTLTSCIPATTLGPMVDLYVTNSRNLPSKRDSIYGPAEKASRSMKDPFFVDVRDAALSHVLAAENKEAAGKRFFIVAYMADVEKIVKIIGEKFPQLSDGWPTRGVPKLVGDINPGNSPEVPILDFDNGRSVEVLGMTYKSLEESIVDTVTSRLKDGGLSGKSQKVHKRVITSSTV